MTGHDESGWQKAVRVGFGWGFAGWVLVGPLPYPIPWWGRLVVAFLLISIAHSTVSGIVLRNVASSGPRIFDMIRGARNFNARELGHGDRRNGENGATTMIQTRRKSDRTARK